MTSEVFQLVVQTTKDVFRRVFRRGSIARSATTLAGGTGSAQLITILAAPLLTRLYSADEFGVFAVYAAVLEMVGIISMLRFELAIPIAESFDEIANLIALCFSILTALLALLIIAIAFLDIAIFRDVRGVDLSPYIWFVPIGIMSGGIFRVCNYWAISEKNFVGVAKSKLIQAIGQVAIQIGGGMFHIGAIALILSQIVGQSAGIWLLGRSFISNCRGRLPQVASQTIWNTASTHRRYMMYMAPASAINHVASNIPAVLLVAFYGPAVAGFYFLATRTLSIPMQLVAAAVSDVLYREVGELRVKSKRQILPLILNISRYMLLIGLFPVIVLMLWGTELFGLIFGSKWAQSGTFAGILSIVFAAQFVSRSVAISLTAIGKQHLVLILHSLGLCAAVGSLTMGYKLWDDPNVTLLVYSVSMFCVYALTFFVVVFQASKYGKS